jgi:hypothetical protein
LVLDRRPRAELQQVNLLTDFYGCQKIATWRIDVESTHRIILTTAQYFSCHEALKFFGIARCDPTNYENFALFTKDDVGGHRAR